MRAFVHHRGGGRFVLALALLASLAWLDRQAGAASLERLAPDLPVTSGLIRWWPNLFDVHDEISGAEGVVMGVLPPVETGAEDLTQFRRETAWVQLRPAITNEVFTFAFWVQCATDRIDPWARLIGQDTGESGWWFQTARTGFDFIVGPFLWDEASGTERVSLAAERWQHVAVARRADGTSAVWVDGVEKLDGQRAHPWPVTSPWLSVGGAPQGGENAFCGRVRDLCVYDRVLGNGEVAALHGTGLPRRVVRNSPARLAATRQPVPVHRLSFLAPATPKNWVTHRYTTEDGLPGNAVKAVLQSRNGFLWVGTDSGLARFDGRSFRVFTRENTPAMKAIGDTVWSLAEDETRAIWAGIFGGLLRVRDRDVTAFTTGLPQRFILQATPAGDGTLWIAGFRTEIPRGPCWLRRYDPATGTSSGEVIVPGHVRQLVPDGRGVWFATEQPEQVHFWDGHAAAPTVVATIHVEEPFAELARAANPGADAGIRIWESGRQPSPVWIDVQPGGANPGFAWFRDVNIAPGSLTRWAGPPAEDRWLGVGRALARVRGEELDPVRLTDAAGESELTSLCANREGGVWVGTADRGLHLVQEQPVRTLTTLDGLSGNDVRSVAATPDGGIWIGSSEGLDYWHGGIRRSPGRLRVRSVVADRNGEPWYGTAEYGPAALRHLLGQPSASWLKLGLDWQDPNSLLFARDGTLWIACEFGVTWLKPESIVRLPDGLWEPRSPGNGFGRFTIGRELPRCFPLGLVEDRDGGIWIGSLDHGAFRLRHGQVEAFGAADGLPGSRWEPVHCDESGAVWLVGDGGLARRQNGRFQIASERDGLPREALFDLIDDGLGYFWISGQRGLHRVSRRELDRFFAGNLPRLRTVTLGMRDGLLTPECGSRHHPSMARTADGHLWVGTRHGVATFDPARIRGNPPPPPVLIEQVIANQRDCPVPGNADDAVRFALEPGSGRRLEFRFTATSLVAADRIRFRYRLEGYDTDWSPESDLRLAFYTNLRPGRYRFRVQASNTPESWDGPGAELPFTIRPYFWQTRVFYGVVALAIGGLGAAIHFRRLARQRRREERRHRQALADEKARIAADMHDELGAALTQIVILGEIGKTIANDVGEARAMLDRMTTAARNMTSRMSDLVWATNPRHDTLDSLVAYLREHAASQLENAPVRSRLVFPPTVPARRVSATFRRNVLLAMTESITNLLRHAEAHEVELRLDLNGEALAVTLRDDGRGFDPAARSAAGNGLTNMRRRIEDLGGRFTLESAPGRGTTVALHVPLPSATS